MVERANNQVPEIPGVDGEIISESDSYNVLVEVDRLVLEEGDHMAEIARIFDASPEGVRSVIRGRLKYTKYETR